MRFEDKILRRITANNNTYEDMQLEIIDFYERSLDAVKSLIQESHEKESKMISEIQSSLLELENIKIKNKESEKKFITEIKSIFNATKDIALSKNIKNADIDNIMQDMGLDLF